MLVSIIIMPANVVQAGFWTVDGGPTLAFVEIFLPRMVQPDGFVLTHFADKVTQTLEIFTSSRQ